MVATQTATTDAGPETEILVSVVTAAIEGPAALAPAYGNHALDILDEYGIPEPSHDGWYDADGFRQVLAHIDVEHTGENGATVYDVTW